MSTDRHVFELTDPTNKERRSVNSNDSGTTGDPAAGGLPVAVTRANAGAAAWEDAVRLQRWAAPDHAEFYALAGEVVRTLWALDDLARVLGRQVSGYGRGRAVYDDTHEVDPQARLTDAVAELAQLSNALVVAERAANRFWSAIGHIGVEHPGQPAGNDRGGRA
jgi:hypothetical protein